MKCFRCEVPLKAAHRAGVEIDYCPECRAVWLDRGELEKMIERFGDAYAPLPPEPSWEDSDRFLSGGRGGSFGEYFDFDER